MNRTKILHGSIDTAIIMIGTLAGLALSNSRLIPEYARLTGIATAAAAMLVALALHSHLRTCAARKLQFRNMERAFTRLDIPLSILYNAMYPNGDSRTNEYLSWRLQYIERNGGVLHVLEMIKAGTLPEIRLVSAEAGRAILRALPEVFGNPETPTEVSVTA